MEKRWRTLAWWGVTLAIPAAFLVFGALQFQRAPGLEASLGEETPALPGLEMLGNLVFPPKPKPSDQLAVYKEKLKRRPPAKAASSSALIFCTEIQQRVTQADCDDYKAQARSAKAGLGAFNAPAAMTRGQTTTLELAVSFKLPPGALTPEDVVTGLPGEVTTTTPTVGRHMAAQLSGEGFTVMPEGLQRHDVTPGSVTTWDWTVRADRAGDHVLVLKTVVEAAKADGGWIPLASTTKNQTIHVIVDKADAIRDVLDAIPDWLRRVTIIVGALTTLITAVIGLIHLFRKPKGGAAGGAAGSAAGAAAGSGTGAMTGGATGGTTGSATGSTTGSTTGSAAGNADDSEEDS